jgi:hypothetical protein
MQAYTEGRTTSNSNFNNLLEKWTSNRGEYGKGYASDLLKRQTSLDELSSLYNIAGKPVIQPESALPEGIDAGNPSNMAGLYKNQYDQQTDAYNQYMGQKNANQQAKMQLIGKIIGGAASAFGGGF